MMAEWLREALVALPVLLLLPLLWLVWSFFADSVNAKPPVEPPLRTRADHLQHAAIWVFITGCWGYFLFERWREAEPDWFVIGLYAIAVVGGLFEVLWTLRKARNSAA